MESPAGKGKGRGKKRAAAKGATTPAQQRSKVVEQFLPTDVSHIRRECDALRDALVYFVPAPVKTAEYPKKYLDEVVARLGGKVPIIISAFDSNDSNAISNTAEPLAANVLGAMAGC